MASPDSFIRSAARATFSAYRRLPIRWRLAGGSAVLTLVILCGFAVIVGILTTQRIERDFQRQVQAAADTLQARMRFELEIEGGIVRAITDIRPDLDSYAAAQNAAIRVVTEDGRVIRATENAPDFGSARATYRAADVGGWRVETRSRILDAFGLQRVYIQYARRLSEVRDTTARVRVFLGLGVLGGAALALLAGVATARRAMTPIAELTDTARRIAETRDPSIRLPHPASDDEVAELARTLESMLIALDAAQGETQSALARQREFIADASHELRTPLTSILANLELLEETLTGDQRDAAASALRSARRMRRLVGDLLLLARADAGRVAAHEPLDLSAVLAEAAGELEPVAGDHEITIDAPAGATVDGVRDDLHRLAVNLLENALRHTDPGTAVQATVARIDGQVVLAVEDDGPGVPPEYSERIFERFFRGAGDRSGSSGLGLAIVRAVADTHHGSVALEPPLDGRGARFVVRLPAAGGSRVPAGDARSDPSSRA